VRAQIQGKEKERKILELTTRELATVPTEGKMYRGVGKM
jgi:prefoldin subunit 1